MADRGNVIIFGGTSEGRELAEYAAGRKIPVLVSVASEYGKNMMTEGPCLRIHCGRLDEAGMVKLLRQEQPVLVIDATHPHAVEVTKRLGSACKTADVKYLRVVREPAGSEASAYGAAGGVAAEQKTSAFCAAGKADAGQRGLASEAADGVAAKQETVNVMDEWRIPDDGGVYWVDTVEQAAELLCMDQEPVLLTTGSKELPLFAGKPSLRDRIYARVLPDSRVLAFCEQQGISGKHLIAMQGPFSAEMNRALIRQIKAGWLVTKESGGRGGFEEKLAVVRECGIRGIVIRRPRQEDGISPEAAKRFLEEVILSEKKADQDLQEKPAAEKKRRISLIGMGMGLGRQLTAEAMEALSDSQAVLGAPRMLADLAPWTKGRQTAPVYLGKDVYEWIGVHPEYDHVAVIYSGDTGFHSGSRGLCGLIRQKAETGDQQALQLETRVYPGISTASCLCARLQTTWEDLYFASAHGCECDAAALLKEHRRVFLLLGGEEALGNLCRALTEAGLGNVQVRAGERLGYENERILKGRAGDWCSIRTDSLTAVILEREELEPDEG